MKKIFLSIVAVIALCSQVDAQSATTFGDALDSVPFQLTYDFPAASPTRFYRDGVQLKDFTISEITVSTNGAVVSCKVTIPGQPKGIFNFTCTILHTSGSGVVVESLPSNICTITVRPNAPGQLRKI